MTQDISQLVKRRLEHLKPKKVQVYSKKYIVSAIAPKINNLNLDGVMRWRMIAKLLKQATPTEASRIYLACVESENFEMKFWSEIKNLNKYKDKKLKQRKLL